MERPEQSRAIIPGISESTLDSKGRVRLPLGIREKLKWGPGKRLSVIWMEDSGVFITKNLLGGPEDDSDKG